MVNDSEKIKIKKIKLDKFNQFYYSVGIMFLVQILIKIVGLIYNVFLTNNVNYSDTGNGIFMSAHQVYILFLVVSISGIPMTITKMISSRSKNGVDVNKILLLNLSLWGMIGIFESVLLIMFSKVISQHILNVEIVEKILKILAISIPFVNLNSVFRGALNGIEKTYVGTIIQFIEQMIKVCFTFVGIFFLKKYDLEDMENILYVVSFGISISIILTFFIYMYKWKKYKNNIIDRSNIRYIDIIKETLRLTIPITILGVFGSLNKNVDLFCFTNVLRKYFDRNTINEMYGIIVSKVDVLINFPIGLNTALIVPLLPKISRLYSENRIEEMENSIKDSLYLSLMFSVPITFIYMIYSKDILDIIYPNANLGSDCLSIGSVLIILNIFMQIVMTYFNAIGKTNRIMKSFILGLICKFILNIILLSIKGIYEKGIISSTIISDVFIIFNLVKDKSVKEYKIKFFSGKMKNILYESIILIFICFMLKNSFYLFNLNKKISLIFSIRNWIFSVYIKKFEEKI